MFFQFWFLGQIFRFEFYVFFVYLFHWYGLFDLFQTQLLVLLQDILCGQLLGKGVEISNVKVFIKFLVEEVIELEEKYGGEEGGPGFIFLKVGDWGIYHRVFGDVGESVVRDVG